MWWTWLTQNLWRNHDSTRYFFSCIVSNIHSQIIRPCRNRVISVVRCTHIEIDSTLIRYWKANCYRCVTHHFLIDLVFGCTSDRGRLWKSSSCYFNCEKVLLNWRGYKIQISIISHRYHSKIISSWYLWHLNVWQRYWDVTLS